MWARVVNICLGIWLMSAPAVLGYAGRAADNDHISGPLAAAAAVIALWEVTRSLRWMNGLVAAWLILAPWVLQYDSTKAVVNSVAVGVLMFCCAMVKGEVKGRYGGGWSSLLG
jgi:hypothetical protein